MLPRRLFWRLRVRRELAKSSMQCVLDATLNTGRIFFALQVRRQCYSNNLLHSSSLASKCGHARAGLPQLRQVLRHGEPCGIHLQVHPGDDVQARARSLDVLCHGRVGNRSLSSLSLSLVFLKCQCLIVSPAKKSGDYKIAVQVRRKRAREPRAAQGTRRGCAGGSVWYKWTRVTTTTTNADSSSSS